jgi:ABC-type transport system involved in multi-copper enzyme maturation permease subunit
MASTYILSPLAVGAKEKIIMDVGLAAISLLGVLAAILVGSTLLHKEVDKRAVHTVLTRPVSRSEYLLGKYCGLTLAVILIVGIMVIIMVLMLLLGSGDMRPAVFAATYLSLLEILVVCAIVVLFSTFTSPVLTSILSLCCFVVGSLSNDLRTFAQKFGGVFMKKVMEVFYVLLPNLKVFNLRHEAVHDLHFKGFDLILATLYAALYCGVVLYFANLIFRRREFA